MNDSIIKGLLTIVLILIFVPNFGIAEEKEELNTYNIVNPTSSFSSYTSQDELRHVYSLYDEGLVDAKYIYQLDGIGNNYDSNSEYQSSLGYDAIDFELYTKNQENINIY